MIQKVQKIVEVPQIEYEDISGRLRLRVYRDPKEPFFRGFLTMNSLHKSLKRVGYLRIGFLWL